MPRSARPVPRPVSRSDPPDGAIVPNLGTQRLLPRCPDVPWALRHRDCGSPAFRSDPPTPSPKPGGPEDRWPSLRPLRHAFHPPPSRPVLRPRSTHLRSSRSLRAGWRSERFRRRPPASAEIGSRIGRTSSPSIGGHHPALGRGRLLLPPRQPRVGLVPARSRRTPWPLNRPHSSAPRTRRKRSGLNRRTRSA